MALLAKIRILSPETAGDIQKNRILMEHIHQTPLTKKIINAGSKGTPLLKLGGGPPQLMLMAGIHGNELPPQIAILELLNKLLEEKLNGTLFIIPFAVPFATMRSDRRFKGFDMNRTASRKGYVSNKILNAIKILKMNSAADFHSTKPNSNPGVESVFCTKKPCYESFKIAKHITKATSSQIISHEHAGALYSGALEDECNLAGVPAVTCEVVSHNNQVDPGSQESSYLQMMAYLDYFEIL
jgi:uncharacterized protein